MAAEPETESGLNPIIAEEGDPVEKAIEKVVSEGFYPKRDVTRLVHDRLADTPGVNLGVVEHGFHRLEQDGRLEVGDRGIVRNVPGVGRD